MEERGGTVTFEEVFDSEINDIWEVIFPTYGLHGNFIPAETETVRKANLSEPAKPRRYMKFLFM